MRCTYPFYPIVKSYRNNSFSVYLSDGTRCRGAYYPGHGDGDGMGNSVGNTIGIYVHGFRSSATHSKGDFFLNHARQRGYSWVTFDLPCHGDSEGEFKKFRISNALESVLKVIQRFRGARLVLLGSSMGAWLSMLAARKLAAQSARRAADGATIATIAGAVLVAPAFDFVREYFRNEPLDVMHKWRREGIRQFTDRYDGVRYELEYGLVEDGLQHDILQHPSVYNFPIRIFHGEQDEVVPYRLSHRFQETNAGFNADFDVTVRIIHQGDHALNEHLPLIAPAMDGMFEAARCVEAV